MKNYKSIICIAAAVCLLGTAAFCGFRIYHHYAQVDEQTEAFEEIAEMVEQAPTEKTVPDDTPVSEGEDVLAKYQELYLQNEDMVGWISIAGTTINYPVMQSRNNPNFYLKHNFEKEYSDLGTPYVQENGDIVESENLVIYGHHIKGGKMFGALEDYKSKNFYEEHKTIQFDTLTEQAEYEIVAIFKTVAYSSEGFRYYDFVDAENFRREKIKSGKDLVYFGRVETERHYRNSDEEVKEGQAKSGDRKPGLQLHVHIIVSRNDVTQTVRLSPLARSKGSFNELNGKKVMVGFEHMEWKSRCADRFISMYGYKATHKYYEDGREHTYHYVPGKNEAMSMAKSAILQKEFRNERKMLDVSYRMFRFMVNPKQALIAEAKRLVKDALTGKI